MIKIIKTIINYIKKIINYYDNIKHIQKARSLAFTIISTILPLLLLINITFSLLPSKLLTIVEKNSDFISDNMREQLFSLHIVANNHINKIYLIIIIITVLVSVLFQVQFIIQLINDVYEFRNDRSLTREIFSSILVFIILLFSIIYISIFMYFGAFLMLILKNFQFLDQVIDIIKDVYLLKNIFFLLSVFLLVSLIYKVAPYKKIKYSTIIPGSLFTTISIFIGSYLFELYTYHSTRYDIMYGKYAVVYLMLLWVYIIANIIIISLSMNVFLYNKTKEVDDATIIIKR